MSNPSPDRAYTVLLSHLHSPNPRLPLSTIQSALAHQLANVDPTPTPLAAITVSSPLYLSQPFTNEKLQSLSVAFRHAAHLKYRALVSAAESRSTLSALLERSMHAVLGQWVNEVLQGVQGGHAVLRLASCGGLLLGLEDLRIGEKSKKREGIDVGSARSPVEDETIVALAEVMDTYAHASSTQYGSSGVAGVEEWEREFQPAGQDVLSLALVLASQTLPLASQEKLKALPLPFLAKLLSSTISSAFKHGTFLSAVSASVSLTPDHLVHISKSSSVAQTLLSVASSPLNNSIPSISRFTANILALLLESPQSRFHEAVFAIYDVLGHLTNMARQIEKDWISCPLADCGEAGIAEDSKDLTKSIWTTLKTFLFCTIMLSESVLSNLVFVPPSSFSSFSSPFYPYPSIPTPPTPSLLAIQALSSLSHLSFVISEFGGVTTTTKGFEQLKKTFYLALDVLASDTDSNTRGASKAEVYVQQICFALNSQRSETAAKRPRQAKQAFVLASIEQLIPVLSEKCVRDWVWGICYPHLNDSSHRETYESAHSVILTIFAVHAQRQQQRSPSRLSSSPSSMAPDLNKANTESTSPSPSATRQRTLWSGLRSSFSISGLARLGSPVGGLGVSERMKTGSHRAEDPGAELSASAATTTGDFIERMIPFYAQCLIENSTEGKLSTPQLCLAYSALVRSSSSGIPELENDTNHNGVDRAALTWYCIQLLLDTIHGLSGTAAATQNHDRADKGKGKAYGPSPSMTHGPDADAERHYRLCLTLVSSVSSLPLSLMLKALNELEPLVLSYPLRGGMDDELVSSTSKDSDYPGDGSASSSSSPSVSKLDTEQTILNQLHTKTRNPLLRALFEEILEHVGDREKEAAVRWWYEHRAVLLGLQSGIDSGNGDGGGGSGSGKVDSESTTVGRDGGKTAETAPAAATPAPTPSLQVAGSDSSSESGVVGVSNNHTEAREDSGRRIEANATTALQSRL